MTRNDAREIMMQILYEMDATKSLDEAKATQLAAERLPGDHAQRGGRLLTETVAHLDEIDAVIKRYAKGWTVSRLPKAELAILRVAITEILYVGDMPAAISCNEAVELAKIYGEEKAPSYINGILGSLIRDQEKESGQSSAGESDE